MAARDEFSGFVPREDIEILRSFSSPRSEGFQYATGPASHVSRRSSARSLINESELEAEVEQLGFDLVSFQTLSLSDQIRLSRDSRVMIGPHGAGLANLVFGNRLQHVFELFSPAYFNDCYARLSVGRGISLCALLLHRRQHGERSRSNGGNHVGDQRCSGTRCCHPPPSESSPAIGMEDIICLRGGLGNQLFQVAFAKWLGRLTRRDVAFDISCLRRIEYADLATG